MRECEPLQSSLLTLLRKGLFAGKNLQRKDKRILTMLTRGASTTEKEFVDEKSRRCHPNRLDVLIVPERTSRAANLQQGTRQACIEPTGDHL